MPEQALHETIRRCLIMLLVAFEKYMVEKGELKERTYFTRHEREEGVETTYTIK